MTTKSPDGWKEPLSRGLWSPDMLLGVAPRGLLAIHLPIGAAVLLHSSRWMYLMAALQAVFMGLTQWDPEWFEIVKGWLTEPEDIEP